MENSSKSANLSERPRLDKELGTDQQARTDRQIQLGKQAKTDEHPKYELASGEKLEWPGPQCIFFV